MAAVTPSLNPSLTPSLVPPLSDETFIAQFENHTLSADYFDHLGHLRIGWLYLNQYDTNSAIERACTGIETYAQSLGAGDKFHFTITDATMRIMAKRIKQQHRAQPSWKQFFIDNQDLVGDALSVLHQHYSEMLLFAPHARLKGVPPDIKAI